MGRHRQTGRQIGSNQLRKQTAYKRTRRQTCRQTKTQADKHTGSSLSVGTHTPIQGGRETDSETRRLTGRQTVMQLLANIQLDRQ